MKIGLLVISVGLLAPHAFAQAQQPDPKKRTPVLSASNAPVTESEARAAFARAELALRHALLIPATKPAVSIPEGEAPVRRSQVVEEYARIFAVIRPKLKMTPVPTKYDPSVFRMSERAALRDLNRLVAMGAVGRVGPLATGPKDSLTVPEFGDALGFFLSRLAELTYLPSYKWTPELEPPPAGAG